MNDDVARSDSIDAIPDGILTKDETRVLSLAVIVVLRNLSIRVGAMGVGAHEDC